MVGADAGVERIEVLAADAAGVGVIESAGLSAALDASEPLGVVESGSDAPAPGAR